MQTDIPFHTEDFVPQIVGGATSLSAHPLLLLSRLKEVGRQDCAGTELFLDRVEGAVEPLALLPIGAYLPRWFMKPAHIDPAEAVEAHKLLGAQTSVPIHYGTFNLGDDGEMQPLDELRRAIAANGVNSFHIIEHGEGFEC